MKSETKSSRDIIIRTGSLEKALHFYETVLGFKMTDVSQTLLGFETGAFKLYVERGETHGPVFDFLVPDVSQAKEKWLAEGCALLEEDALLPRCYVRDPFGVTFNIGKSAV